jgi:hypothetical protein
MPKSVPFISTRDYYIYIYTDREDDSIDCNVPLYSFICQTSLDEMKGTLLGIFIYIYICVYIVYTYKRMCIYM